MTKEEFLKRIEIKKYNLLFKLSFSLYILIIFARPYVSAKVWADAIVILFVIAVGYQLLYLFHLRKKEHLKFGRAIAQYFLCFLLSLEVWTVLHCADLFINGFTPRDWLGSFIGETVYGWAAITGDGIDFFCYSAIMLVSTIYQIVYAMVFIRKKNSSQKGE